MAEDTNTSEDDSGPEMSMEGCLYAGLSHADFNLEELDDKSRKLVESVGKVLVRQRTGLAIPEDLRAVAEYLLEMQKDPWFEFGVDYELGHAGTYRVIES